MVERSYPDTEPMRRPVAAVLQELSDVIEAVRGDRSIVRVSGLCGNAQDVGVVGIDSLQETIKRACAELTANGAPSVAGRIGKDIAIAICALAAEQSSTPIQSTAQISELDDASNACLELAAKHGYATGHGDTVADMIREFSAQIPIRVPAQSVPDSAPSQAATYSGSANALAVILRRCRTVLGNMALENETGLSSIFNRWPISHEPLRADAKNLVPLIDEALFEYHTAFLKSLNDYHDHHPLPQPASVAQGSGDCGAKAYVERAIASYIGDPADNQFQKGFLAALEVVRDEAFRPENCASADAVCHFPSCVCVNVNGNIVDPYAVSSTHSRCAKCHCETKGEAALVDGKIWCHPCADSVPSTQSATPIDHSNEECPNFPGCHCVDYCIDGWKHPSPEVSSTSRCTCAAIVNPNIPHARTCPLSSTDGASR